MMLDKETMLNNILEVLSHLEYIKSADIPNIDLYMDQVTTFMDEHLEFSKRYPEDKVLTKTMINNYAKNHLLPPPVKKKYSKEHLLVLIFIYYFKGFMSFQDIQSVLNPLTERFFHTDAEFSMEKIYEDVLRLEKEEFKLLEGDVQRMYHTATEAFQDAPDENQDFLQLFSMICLLSFDVYVKKLMIEKLIDNYNASLPEDKKHPKK